MNERALRRLLTGAVALLTLLAGGAATGQTCEEARPLDGQRLLRRLSIDLRGTVPSLQDQRLQGDDREVSAATIDAFLDSTDFAQTMRSHHSTLLWPNVDTVDIEPVLNRLYPFEIAPGELAYYSLIRAYYLRSVVYQYVPCGNYPAEFDASGNVVMFPLIVNGQVVGMQEGWVMVEPYWAPGTKVKVCALDAQSAAAAPTCTPDAVAQSPFLQGVCNYYRWFAGNYGANLESSATSCDGPWSFLTRGCGCGKNLERCNTGETAALIRKSLIEQQLRMVDRVALEGRPYTDLILSKDVEVNGYLAHYLRHQSRVSSEVFGEIDASAPLPEDLDWSDGDNWVTVTRTGRHSGVLTTPGYLMRFTSNRGRAHRFYNAFECSAFSPDGPLPSASAPCSKQLDLSKRCGCDACHVKLEPMTAHWGRFAEMGFTPLDEARYPKTREQVCTNFKDLDQIFRCLRFYKPDAKTRQEVPYLGVLWPYVFGDHAEVAAIEEGPSRLARASIDSGRFSGCTVRRMWALYMRRPPTPEEEVTVIPELEQRFAADGYRLRELVRRIVSLPAYGRAR